MISMTGFGRGEASNSDVSVVVEMKSVNNRFRDIQLRVPREYMLLEQRIHDVLRQYIARGRVEVYVRRQAGESGQRVRPDLALAERYLRAMVEIAKHLQRDATEIPLSRVLDQPGVLSLEDADTDALAEWDVVGTALEAAVGQLVAMRQSEGMALESDLRRHLADLRRLRDEVEAAADGVAERLKARLDARLSRLLGDRSVDPVRLAQEAAILADKADIREELARISSHCDQFEETLACTGEPIGRKLDFLLQELNREVNTIGSKTTEHPIAARVVELKSVLERMREQAANVE